MADAEHPQPHFRRRRESSLDEIPTLLMMGLGITNILLSWYDNTETDGGLGLAVEDYLIIDGYLFLMSGVCMTSMVAARKYEMPGRFRAARWGLYVASVAIVAWAFIGVTVLFRTNSECVTHSTMCAYVCTLLVFKSWWICERLARLFRFELRYDDYIPVADPE